VDIQFTSEQVLALAPDSSSAAAGKKLGSAKHWKNLGRSADALWGECQGSALYQVKVELASLASHCSCPSRKLPCKHCLGLLLLATANQADVAVGEPPEWVADWLAKRQASSARKQEKAAKAAESAGQAPSAQQLKNAGKRLASVKKGVDGLDLWLNDLIRQGLASVQTQPASFWEHQAARLRDAQAGALDARVRRFAAIPNATPDWPEILLAELGKLALLTYAFHQEEQLERGMREEVRQLIGWTLNQEEVNERGETVRDDWLVVGQVVEDAERGKTQRTWLSGLNSGRTALILQFSFDGHPFSEQFVLGAHQEVDLAYWPGAYPQRAQVRARVGELAPFQGEWPGVDSIDEFLDGVASALGSQPWLERFLAQLRGVTPVCDSGGASWSVRDSAGRALHLAGSDHWQLLALSGGHPVDLVGEWRDGSLLPLGALVDWQYIPFGRAN
jgi:uncharacterized Zn finger protein